MAHVLFVTAVEAEARTLASIAAPDVVVVAGGVGRVNAALAVARSVTDAVRPFDVVVSWGVAGSLPGSGLAIGDLVVASESVYHEEGLVTPAGFGDVAALGFPLGEAFRGNVIQADPDLLARFDALGRVAPIATVATCSGTDAAAREVADRTGAVAEAMEGAAVLHAASRFSIPAIELRAISNTTGDRTDQAWDLAAAFATLRRVAPRLTAALATA